MGNLTKCAALAKAAGISYGQYMAIKGETPKKETPKQESEFLKKCQWCGKEFYWPYKRRKIFCDVYCQKSSAADRYRREKARGTMGTIENRAVENGWKHGDRFCKLAYNEPIGPDNCRIIPQDVKEEDETAKAIKRWNRTVNIWRKHFGLPLFDE